MKVRAATPADATGIAQVRVDAWQAAYRGYIADDYLDSLTWVDSAVRFRNSMGVPARDEHFLVAEEGGVIVGFVIFGPERAVAALDRGEIYAIYVHPEDQGRGVGSRLFLTAVASLQMMGMRSLLVWTLENGPSTGFYEHFGGLRTCLKNMDLGGKNYGHVAYCWNSETLRKLTLS